MIHVENLTKAFADMEAIHETTLGIPEGDFLTIAGPNGAGKTTLLRLIGGLYYPDSGNITVKGLDRSKDHLAIKQFTAYLDDEPQILCSWSGRAQLEIVADIYGVPRNEIIASTEELIHLFQLEEVIDKPPLTFSKGQLKKLSLATAFITRAKLFLLDEPFTGGLDPNGHQVLKEILGEMARRPDITVIMTTQVVDMVTDITKRVLLLQKGRIQAFGTPEELKQKAGDGAGSLEKAVSFLTAGQNVREAAGKVVR